MNELIITLDGQAEYGRNQKPFITATRSFPTAARPLAGISLEPRERSRKFDSVGRQKLSISRAEEIRTLLLVVVLTLIPLVGTALIVGSTAGPDLSHLISIQRQEGAYSILNWPELLRTRHAMNAGLSVQAGTVVRALGYMTDGERAMRPGVWVGDFVLMPETGNILHPAHRFGDQMIQVYLDARIQFAPWKLVWVWGTLRSLSGDQAGSQPLYALERARAEPAAREDVRRYFK